MARVLIIVLGAASAFWIAIGVTSSLTVPRQVPRLVLALWPAASLPKIALGTELLMTQRPSREVVARSREAVREAAIREPVSSFSVGLLASYADHRGEPEKARRLFGLSEKLSRRNLVTQMWLIEDAVAREDVAGAVDHYDRTMRASLELRDALMPILVDASMEPEVRKTLMPVIARRPPWWKSYIAKVAAQSKSSKLIEGSLLAVRPDLRDETERNLTERMLRRLAAIKAHREAANLANTLEGLPDGERTLRSGEFDTEDGLRPFGWRFRDKGGVRAYRDSVPNGSMGLRIVAEAGASGRAAWQLIALGSGTHYLSGVAGDVSEERLSQPRIEISCVDGISLGKFRLPAAPERSMSFKYRFEVPATGCDAQWVIIEAAPAVETDCWIDDLKLLR